MNVMRLVLQGGKTRDGFVKSGGGNCSDRLKSYKAIEVWYYKSL